MKRMNNKQKGFTIIELVVVILLLGILTATALPRFMDVTTQAHTAVNNGVQSALQASTSMFFATYTALGEPASGTAVAQYGLDVNADGYPVVDPSIALTAAHCATIYDNLMQAGGRPTVAANATPAVEPTAAEINAATTDFVTYVLAGSPTICRYVYAGEAVVQTTGTAREITYNTDTGVVTLTATTTLE